MHIDKSKPKLQMNIVIAGEVVAAAIDIFQGVFKLLSLHSKLQQKTELMRVTGIESDIHF